MGRWVGMQQGADRKACVLARARTCARVCAGVKAGGGMDERADGQTDGRTDGRTDGWTDGRTDATLRTGWILLGRPPEAPKRGCRQLAPDYETSQTC